MNTENVDSTMPDIKGAMRKYMKWIIPGVIILVLLTGFLSWNGVRKDANRRELAVNTSFGTVVTALGNCETMITEGGNLTKAELQAIRETIQTSVSGRNYSEDAFVVAVTEALPDTSGISEAVGELRAAARACRTAFSNAQNDLKKIIEAYDVWANDKMTVMVFKNLRSSKFRVDNGSGLILRGDAALEFMRRIMVPETAAETIRTGVVNPQEFDFSDGGGN